MSLFFCLGKTILAISLILYAYLILLDPQIKSHFDESFKSLSTLHPHLNILSVAFPHLDYIRFGFAIAKLFSVFLIFTNGRCIPILLILDLVLFSVVFNNPFLVKDAKIKEEIMARLLKTVAIIGGLLYLASCGRCCKKGAKEKAE